MKVKKLFYKITIILLILFFFIPKESTASMSDLFSDASEFLKTDGDVSEPLNEKKIIDLGNSITSLITNIGIALMVVILIILGIVFLMDSAEYKERYKEKLIPFLIGAVIVVAGTNIWSVVYNTATSTFDDKIEIKSSERKSSTSDSYTGSKTKVSDTNPAQTTSKTTNPTTSQVQTKTSTSTPTPKPTTTQPTTGGNNSGKANNDNKEESEHLNGKKIFIGDSRTVGMKQSLSSSEVSKSIWYCVSGEKYGYMANTAYPQAKNYLTKGSKLIILMGVNDVWNVTNYAKWINEKANAWKEDGVRVYFVSLNPINDYNAKQNGYQSTNKMVVDFNNKIKPLLNSNVTYIDTYSQIINNFYAGDGVHYNGETYRKIYNIICEAVD